MRCHEFETRLNDLLDERRQPRLDVQLSRHTRQCDQCEGLLRSFEAVFEGLQSLPPLEIESELGQRVVADFRPTVAMRLQRRENLRGWSRWLMVAAAMLMAAVPAWFVGRMSSDSRDGDPPAPTIAKDVEPITPSGSMLAVSYNYQKWAQIAAPIANRPLEVAGDVADGLKPVANSMSAALDALRRTIPRGSDTRSSSRLSPDVFATVA
jgi:hypothetical protein